MITPINTFAFYTLSNILSILAIFLDMLYPKHQIYSTTSASVWKVELALPNILRILANFLEILGLLVLKTPDDCILCHHLHLYSFSHKFLNILVVLILPVFSERNILIKNAKILKIFGKIDQGIVMAQLD